jgi:hypothetical protein
MKTFLIVSLCILALALPFIGIYLVENWKRLIWENKGGIFRFITDGENWFKGQPMWVVEKRFLWFWVDCSEILDKSHFFTCKEAAECLSKYLQKLDKKQNPESHIVNYNQFISDPTRQLEAKNLETKRIEYDKD